jgi:hypothetical protein
MRTTAYTARNRTIVERVLQGESCGAVARAYGLSTARVFQLVYAQAVTHGGDRSGVPLATLRAYYQAHGSLEGLGTAAARDARYAAWCRDVAKGVAVQVQWYG